MTFSIRRAVMDDISRLAEMAERRRGDYEMQQPVFWRRSPDARKNHLAILQRIVPLDEVIVLVFERDGAIRGYVVASLVPPPPFFDPGGPTCLIDEFVVSDTQEWEPVGLPLLNAANEVAQSRGAVQTIVVCPAGDNVERGMLHRAGFSTASEWFVRTTQPPAQISPDIAD